MSPALAAAAALVVVSAASMNESFDSVPPRKQLAGRSLEGCFSRGRRELLRREPCSFARFQPKVTERRRRRRRRGKHPGAGGCAGAWPRRVRCGAGAGMGSGLGLLCMGQEPVPAGRPRPPAGPFGVGSVPPPARHRWHPGAAGARARRQAGTRGASGRKSRKGKGTPRGDSEQSLRWGSPPSAHRDNRPANHAARPAPRHPPPGRQGRLSLSPCEITGR